MSAPARARLAKISRPAAASAVARPRLHARLDEARRAAAAWVSGPPGCGKTTLVSDYVERGGLPTLWYQLDDGDGDVATFFYYLGLAAADGGEPLPLLTPEYHAGVGVFARTYFRELFARLGDAFCVVLDGFHEIATPGPMHEVLLEAIREMPPDGCLVIISRGDPAPAFARVRANGQLAVLDWDDLRLTKEELAGLLKQRRLPAGVDEVAELHERTQGWAAGLVLLLEQRDPGTPIPSLPDQASRQVIFDYLAGEILQKSEPRVQRFLMRIAYLPRMTAEMAGALAGDEGAGEILEDLHRRNYFVAARRDGAEPVFEFHPMFREFLASRVSASSTKEERRRLQRNSAARLEAHGYVEEAFALFRDGHEWEDAARIITAHAAAMHAQGRDETLVQWVEDLPTELRARQPWLVYWVAAARAQPSPREARQLFEQAFEGFRAAGEQAGTILACSGAMDAILYELDDFSLLDRWISELDSAAAGVPGLAPDAGARVACSMFFSLTLRQPHRADIPTWIERALAAAAKVEDPNHRMFVNLLAALTATWTGMQSRAGALIEAARRLAAGPGVSPFSRITLRNVEAMQAMLVADAAAGVRAMREGLDIARSSGIGTWSFQLLVYGYGALVGAAATVPATLPRQLDALAPHAGRFNLCLLHHFRAWEASQQGDAVRALAEQKTALKLALEVGCPFFEVLCRMSLAQQLAALGDERKCVSNLRRVRELARTIPNAHLEFTCLASFADLALRHGRERAGLNALRRAFEIGREYGYAHFLGWRGDAMARLCAAALEHGIEREYARTVIARRGLVPHAPPLAEDGWPWAISVRTFGGFRLRCAGADVARAGKAQKRPLDLMKVVLALGGERVAEEKVAEALWPRIDGDSAHQSFNTALHRLRKYVGEERAFVLSEGKLSVDPRYLWSDTRALDAAVRAVDDAARAAPADVRRLQEAQSELLALYAGPFLADEPDEPWLLVPRERWRNRFLRCIASLAQAWSTAGLEDRVSPLFEDALEREPHADTLYRQYAEHLQRLGRAGEAEAVLKRAEKASRALADPSPRTR